MQNLYLTIALKRSITYIYDNKLVFLKEYYRPAFIFINVIVGRLFIRHLNSVAGLRASSPELQRQPMFQT